MADDVLILIPARMASTRLPGKPLLDIAGEPMIAHVLRRAQEAAIGPVVVATDDETIATAVEKAGGRAIMTRSDHARAPTASPKRSAWSIRKRRARIVVNVQGDLPTLAPRDLALSLTPLDDPAVDIATLAAAIKTPGERDNPNVVKVTGTPVGPARLRALTFARSATGAGPHYHHIGLYAYRRAALERFVKLPPSAGERHERLEQLRALEAGMRIDVMIVDSVPLGVDTPQDLEIARAMLR